MEKSFISRALLFIFAALGAAGSLITVIAYFGASSPSLIGKIHVNKIALPVVATRQLEDDVETHTLSDFFRIMRLELKCDDLAVDKAESSGNVDREADPEHTCKHLSDFDDLRNTLGRLSEVAVLSEIEIKNEGSLPATNIRMSPKGVLTAEFKDSEGGWEPLQKDESGFYDIPDLNPSESVTINAYFTGVYSFDYTEYDVERFVPTITHSRGSIDYVKFYQSARFRDSLLEWGVIDWFFFIVVVLFGSFSVVILTLLPVAIIDALRKGKPISSVFKGSN